MATYLILLARLIAILPALLSADETTVKIGLFCSGLIFGLSP